MDLEKHFHMTGGSGSTSYARNSFLQKKASEAVKHIILEALKRVYLQLTPVTIGIADLGCCSGPNTLSIIKDMVACIEATTHLFFHPCPDFHLYLNDLPTNDFNTVFKALPDFRRELEELITEESPSFYIAGYPGSFYGRLFPSDSLHFVYSSNSLHWLSKVPPGLYDDNGKSINKGNIYISESSPAAVSRAYFSQFQEDFSSFLKSRSGELVPLGRMVLIFLGRSGPDHVDRGNSFFWELLSRALATTVSQGHIKEKIGSYHAHFYAPSKGEIEEEVRRDGSFKIEKLDMFQIERNDTDGESYGTSVEKTVRAIQEPMILHHFSVGEGGLDTLFEKYGQLVDEEMAKEEIKPLTLVLVLRKLRLFEEVNIRNLLPADSDEGAR